MDADASVVHVINKVLSVPEVDSIASVAAAVAASSNELNLLLAAVMRSPTVLAAVLDPATEVTVLAPSNAAFEAFLGDTPLEDVPEEALTSVLLYHIVPTRFLSTDPLSLPITLDTALALRSVVVGTNGTDIIINPDSDNAKVILADVIAGRSVVHVIDTVLSPPSPPTIASVATGAADDLSLSIFLEAVVASEEILKVATNPESAVTVLAPTNAAFADALTALGVSKDELLGDEHLLTRILAYHVIPHPVASSAFSSRKTIAATTLPGAFLTIQVVAGEVRIENGLLWHGDVGADEAKVTTADIPAGFSVVHVIDKVLVPPSRPTSWGSILRWIHGLFH